MQIFRRSIIGLAAVLAAGAVHAQQLRQPVDPTGRIAPPVTRFSVLRSDVRFDDGSLFRVAASGDTVRGELRVLSDGVGLLAGVWELSEPGVSGFRPVSRVRIASAGRQTRRVLSPTLPAQRAGQYELRFRADGAAPTRSIRYVVVRAPQDDLMTLALRAPLDGQRIAPGTVFRWMPVDDAASYRLEIMGAGDRLAAVDTGSETATLRPPAQTRLRASTGPISWRVTAYGADGRVVAVSPQRPISGGLAR